MTENQTIEPTEEINAWCYVEIFGHTRVAGRVTTKKLGSEVMFQVDVPKGETEFSHSELYSPKSIFSIKPTTEEWCRRFCKASAGAAYQILPYIPESRQLAEPVKAQDYDADLDNEDDEWNNEETRRENA